MESRPDNRGVSFKRTNSLRCYVGELLCGTGFCTWTFNKLTARDVYIINGILKVSYEEKYYPLCAPEKMRETIRRHIEDDGIVVIDGNYFRTLENIDEVKMHYFVDITEEETYSLYEKLRPVWLENKDQK